MRRTHLFGGSPLTVYLLLLVAFSVGVMSVRLGWLPGGAGSEPPGLGRTFSPFWETWHLVQKYYVDQEAVRPERMTQGAIQGMLASLGDVGHTTYLSAEELSQLKKGLEGELEGIGAQMTVRKRRPTVMVVFAGSPAQEAGLRAGDVIQEVNGKVVTGLPVDRVAAMVRGPAGTEASLQIVREGEPKPLNFRITRRKIDVPSVTWHLLPGRPVAHLAIRDFGKHAHAQLKEALRGITQRKVKGLVLDVRGNPGGLKDQAVAVTSEFLREGNVFIEQDAQGHRTAVPVKPGGEATYQPLVVLIDEGTASSAEILAGALQDHGRAKLVGTRTFGTGTVLKPFLLSDGSAVLLAVEEWFTPKGRQIWHKGIAPDIEVPLPDGATMLLPGAETGLTAEGLAKSKDEQLLKALEVVQKQIR